MSAEHNHPPRCCCRRCTCDPGPEGRHHYWCAMHDPCPACPEHGALACTCPPHMDGIGREKWPDCPIHSRATPYTEQETTNG